MTRTRIMMLLSVLLLAGCPTRPGPDEGKTVGTTPAPDAGTPETSLPTLRIASPASNTSTNGVVAVTVDVTGGAAPATIQLLEDGTVLATLVGPAPYTYSWDTQGVADGTHTLVAKAIADGESIASAPVTITVDRTAPTIISTTPTAGAPNVVLRAPIVLTFSEPILASSFTASAVSLQVGGTIVPTVATLSSDGTSATIAINDLSSFALPATFLVTLSTAITDLTGNALKIPATAWNWIVPDWIKYAPLASSTAPALAVGPNFQPTVAFSAACFGNASSACVDYLSVAASDGQQWNSLGQLPTMTGPGSMDLDAQGHPIVAGIVNAGGAESVTVATWNGSSWDSSISPLGIDSSSVLTASPIVRLDPSGRPVIAWKDAVTATAADVGVARWTGVAWDKSFGRLGLTATSNHSLILDGNGNPIVGFCLGTNGIGTVSRGGFGAWNGTSWTFSGTYPSEVPVVVLDGALEPTMLVAYTVDHYSNGSWQPIVNTAIPGGNTSSVPHLALTPDHQPVVAWINATAPTKIGLARWTGSQWSARAGLFNAGGVVTADAPGVPAEVPGLVVDSRGSSWVYWREGSSVNVWMSNY
jgi:hypothetical protein